MAATHSLFTPEVIAIVVAFAPVFVGLEAWRKGRSVIIWALLTLIFMPLGIIPYFLSAIKKCPHCAQKIPKEARVCPFCRLGADAKPAVPTISFLTDLSLPPDQPGAGQRIAHGTFGLCALGQRVRCCGRYASHGASGALNVCQPRCFHYVNYRG